jgi:DNA mismatch repair ATPase MutS
MEGKGIEAKANNFLTAVTQVKDKFGFAYVDLSTGELKTALLHDELDNFPFDHALYLLRVFHLFTNSNLVALFD